MALRLLDAEGLTTTSQGRSGVRIRHPEPERTAPHWCSYSPSPSDLGDLLDFRKMLEPAAAAHVAEHATAQQREHIAAVAERGIAPDGTGYHEFHELLVQASGNPLLTTVLAAVDRRCGGPPPTRHHSIRPRRSGEVASRDRRCHHRERSREG